jgi:hypothetical protein
MYYALDVGAAYHGGTTVAGLSGDVDSAKSAITTAVDGVAPGSEHGAGQVATGLSTFREWVSGKASSVSAEVSNLGNNTSEGAATASHTTNETTSLQNVQTAHNDGTVTTVRRPINV